MGISIIVLVPLVLKPYRRTYIAQSFELRDPECFIIGSKHAYSLLQRQIASLPFKGVNYTDLLEKIIRNKGQLVLCLQDIQKCERSVRNCLPIYSKDYVSFQTVRYRR